MSTDPITLIADTIRAHRDVIEPARWPWRAKIACVCGEWSVAVPPARLDWSSEHDQLRRHRAERVVAALTQAGHMLPPGGETRQVWAMHSIISGGRTIHHSLAAARRAADHALVAGPLEPPPHPVRLETATQTTWPDGRQYTSPWQEVSGQ